MKGPSRAAIGGFIRHNVRKVIIGLAVLLLFSLVSSISLKTVLIIPLLILAASFSTFYFNYFTAPVNLELVKLATVLASVTYGLVPGLAVGLISTFLGKALIGRVDEKLPFSMLTISMLAAGASIFSSVGITALGITLVVAYNIIMLVLTQVLGGNLAWSIPYEGTSLLFNIFLFTKAAPLLQQLMG